MSLFPRMSFQLRLLALVLLFSAVGLAQSAPCTNCSSLNLSSTTVPVGAANFNDDSALATTGIGELTVTLSPNSTTYLPAGNYPGWCFSNPNDGVDSSDPYTANSVISQYGSPLANEVNYILNHKQGVVGYPAPSIADVQVAIWLVIGNTPASLITDGVTISATATALAAAAQSVGATFVPAPGQTVGVVLKAPGTGNQPILIEIKNPCAAVGDFVWNDVNQNGIQDAWEQGINGVTLTLTPSSGSPITTVTSATPSWYTAVPQYTNGWYQFSGLSPSCSYTVTVGSVPGMTPTKSLSTPVGYVSNNGSASFVPNGLPVTDENADFGFYSTTVNASCPASTGTVGVSYSSSIGAGGGTGSYTYTVIPPGSLPPGLTLSGNQITGTPGSTGSYPFSIEVMDTSGTPQGTAGASCSITVSSPPPVTANCVSITAIQNVQITPVTMQPTGGTGTGYKFTATGLPAGLSIDLNTGTISGTPTVSGTFPYTVTITDSAGNKGTVNCSVTVYPPVTANCVSITAIQNSTITPVTLTATGGTGTGYKFSATGLPNGLTISSSGTISGTPLVSGTFSYTVTITDSAGNKGTATCSVTVTSSVNVCGLTWGYWKNHLSAWPVTSLVLGSQTYSQTDLVNLLNLPVAGDASINLAHQLIAAKLNVLNGTNPSTDGGSISAADSLLSTFSGKLPYNVDASSAVGQQMTSISGDLDYFNSDGVAQPGCSTGPAPLSVTCAASTGQVNVAYSSAVTASGGVAPYSFAIVSGTLPPGLTLNPTTGAIAGTPTTAGVYNFSVQVSDATAEPGSTAGTVTTKCSITIQPKTPTLTVKCPPATTATVGTSYSSSATATGGTAPYTFAITSGALPPGLSINSGNGSITGSPTASGTYSFTVTATDYKLAWGSCNCSIVVSGGGIKTGQYITYTQGGWGAPPHGNNPGALLNAKFTTVYPGGSVTIGGTYKLTFTSALAIINFLPQGGTPGKLAANATNPSAGTAAGVFAGQVLALQLSVDFSNKGILPAGLANLKVSSGLMAGQTVQQVLATANAVLGGGAPPAGMSISDLNNVIDAINSNFDSGTSNNGYLQ